MHGVINEVIAIFCRNMNVHAINAIPFSNLDGCAHLLQIAIETDQVQRFVRTKIDDNFKILSWFNGF